tara:strand:- start:361 stop:654 length:294 start_codon:yes stop_codon:yes gene_type:complete
MNLNIENLVRSGVVLVVGLPVALSLGGLTSATTRVLEQNASDPTAAVSTQLKERLTKPCLLWGFSKNDSKLEREAKNQIDEIMGGEVSYPELCGWVL